MLRRTHWGWIPVACLLGWSCSSYGAAPSPDPTPAPTRPEMRPITAERLQSLLYAFADDSMEGRRAGTPGNLRATAFLAAQAEAIGLEPAGDDGTYFQAVPLRTRTPVSALAIDGVPLVAGDDVVGLPPIQQLPVGLTGAIDGASVVFAGAMNDGGSLAPEDVAGKVVVLHAPTPGFGVAVQALLKYREAAAIVMAVLDYMPAPLKQFLSEPSAYLDDGSPPPSGPLTLFLSTAATERLFGGPLNAVAPGTEATRRLTGNFAFEDRPTDAPAHNVVAILRGGDPALRSQYVALGSHNDHVGTTSDPVDHDSLRVFLGLVRPHGADSPDREPTVEETAQIAGLLERRRAEAPPRPDSISNGADDDGSGSVAMVEVARRLADLPTPPRRSVLFVWHTGEELGLLGSQHYTEHSTVPRGDIVAQINMDMIGRDDETAQGDSTVGDLFLIGSRRLSTEFGNLIETVNTEDGFNFRLDYTYDADGHPDQIYCRSDHYMYARFGIPVAFFTTGTHRDYHQVTDEPQYIDYGKLARVAELVTAVTRRVANLEHRLVVDGPVSSPEAPCQQ